MEKAKPAAKAYTIPVFKAEPKADPVKPAKPRIRVKARSIPSLTMAEMLRDYGHVPPVQQHMDFRWSRPAQ